LETKLFIIGIAGFLLSLVYRLGLKSEKIFKKIFFILISGFFWCCAGTLLSLFLSLFFREEFEQTKWIIWGCIFGFIFGIFAGLFSEKEYEKKKKIIFWQKDWIDTIWSSVLLASVIMYFIIQAFKIPSGSMRMTLLEGDHLFVSKFIYGFRVPFTDGKKIFPLRRVQHKDIVVFECPPTALSPEEKEKGIKKDFIKRALGLPGDIIEIKDKKLYVNGILQDEPYVNFETKYIQPKIKLFDSQQDYQKSWEEGRFVNLPVRDNFGPVKVPEGHFFVIGDNRDKSFDSRFWGPLSEKYLKGRPLLIYWPPNRIRIIK